jgi:hypothetical protein
MQVTMKENLHLPGIDAAVQKNGAAVPCMPTL